MPSRAWTLAQRQRAGSMRKYTPAFFRSLNRSVVPVLKALEQKPYTQVLPKIDKLIPSAGIEKDFKSLYLDVTPRWARRQYNALRKSSQQDINNNVNNSLSLKDEVNDMWLNAIREFIADQAGARITSITDQSKELCLKLLEDELAILFDEGLSVEKLTRKLHNHLKKEWPKIQRYRARRIARTEVNTASNYGQFIGADATEMPLLKKWITTADARTRDAHIGMLHHPMIKKELFFDVGGEPMMFPGDFNASAGNVINCRCTTAYALDRS